MPGLEELTPAQANALRLGTLLLEKNPDIARKAKRLAKEADPSLRLPEIELEDQIAAATKVSDEKVAELEQRLIAQDVAQRRREFRAECERLELKPEDVEKIVVDEKCSTGTAIKLAIAQRQTADPGAAEVFSSAMHTPTEIRPDADWRKLSGASLRRRSAEVAREMISGFLKNRRLQTR